MKLNNLHDVFVDGLRDLYNAEQQLIRALPRMAKAAHSPELRDAFQEHLEVTQHHAERLEEIFDEIEEKPGGKNCPGMQGIIEEGSEVIKEGKTNAPDSADAALIAAAQKVEHYEMSGYGSCRTFATTLGLSHIAELLQETLDEEAEADQALSQLAESSINEMAAAEGSGMSGGDGHSSDRGREYQARSARTGDGGSRTGGRSKSRARGASRSRTGRSRR